MAGHQAIEPDKKDFDGLVQFVKDRKVKNEGAILVATFLVLWWPIGYNLAAFRVLAKTAGSPGHRAGDRGGI